MTINTRSRTRAAQALSRNTLYFATQADADAYTLQQAIKSIRGTRATRQKRFELRRLHACHDALKAPVYKLPDEILTMILTLACNNLTPSARVHRAIDLSHVTRRWRAVVVSIHRLWTHISVNPDIEPLALVTRITAVVARSSSFGLRVSIDLSDLIAQLDNGNIKLIADAVCRKVYPKCEQLTIRGNFVWDSNAQDLAPGLFTFQLTPHLRALSIIGVEFSHTRSVLFLQSLQSCSALEDLTLANCDCWPENHHDVPVPGVSKTSSKEEHPVYKLPVLRRLTSLGDMPVQLVAHLDLPVLHTWTCGDYVFTELETGMLTLLEEYSGSWRERLPNLSKLTVDSAMMNVQILVPFILKLLPLDVVTVDRVDFVKRNCYLQLADLQAATPTAQIGTIELIGCSRPTVFLEMLFALTKPHSLLCKIRAKPALLLTEEDYRKLQRYAADIDWTLDRPRRNTATVLVPSSP